MDFSEVDLLVIEIVAPIWFYGKFWDCLARMLEEAGRRLEVYRKLLTHSFEQKLDGQSQVHCPDIGTI